MAGPWEDYGPPEPKAGPWSDYASEAAVPEEKPFFDKLGNFLRKVYENPPPLAGAVAKAVSGAVTLPGDVYAGRVDPLSEEAVGRAAELASIATPMAPRGAGGIFARSTAPAGTPILPPRPAPQPSAVDPALEAAGRLGVDIPRYMATESTVMPQMAAGLKNVPWAGQPIVRTAEDLTANLGRAAGEIAPGHGTAETAGQAAKSGLTDYLKAGSKDEVGNAYKAVDALIDPDVRVPLTHTAQAVAELRARRANAMIEGDSNAIKLVANAVKDPLAGVAPELRAGLMRRNPELAQSPGLNYQGVKDLRSHLGNKTNFQLAAEGIDPKEKRFLYAALSKDLGRTVTEAGGPEAFSAWRKANVLAHVAKGEEKKLSKILGVATDAGPEAVFNKLTTYANSNAGADMGRLRLAKRAMGLDAWSEIAPVIIDRLGKAAVDTPFSPDRFVTAWGKMSAAAKNELFTGQQYAALSDLFTVSNHVKERITKFGNPSGTARGMTGNTLLGAFGGGALWAEPVSAIASIVGTRLVAEAMSRPAIVRAATAVSRASLAGNPVRTQKALAALRAAVVAEGLGVAQGQQQPEGRR